MKIRKNAFDYLLFLDLPLFLLGLNYMLYNAFSMDILKTQLRVLSIILLLIGCILKKNIIVKKKAVLSMALAIVALLLNGSTSLNLVVIILFSVCAIYPLNSIVQSAFKVNLLLVTIMIVLMLIGIVDNTSYISTMGRLRYTLGFDNPNVAALFYSSAIYLMLVSMKKTKVLMLVAFLMSLILFYYTNSRTTLLALITFVFLEGIYSIFEKRKMDKSKVIFGKLSILSIDILFVVNLLSVFLIEKFMIFDELLSYRISTFSKMINSSGLRSFLLGGTHETVDNFYYMLLFQYGIFIYIFVACLTHFAMKKMVNKGYIKYIALLVGLFLVGMMESSLIRPEILVSLIVWKVIISGDDENHKNNNLIIDE